MGSYRIVLLALSLFFLLLTSFVQETSAQDPVGRWRMDEAVWSGQSIIEVKDDSLSQGRFDGKAVNGASVTTISPARSGDPGTCSYGTFSGNQYVSVPYSELLNPNDFTVALWARVDSGSGGFRSAITSRFEDTAGNQQGYIIYVDPSNRWTFWTGVGNGWDVLGSAPAAIDTWTHVAISFSSSGLSGNVLTGSMKLYINGSVVAQKLGRYRPNRTGPVTIGAGGGTGNVYHFRGNIDEVMIYNVALSDSVVQSLYTATHSCPGVQAPQEQNILQLQLDESVWTGASSEVKDSSGNNFNGAAVNNPITTTFLPARAGDPGSCGYGIFNGNQSVDVPYNQQLNPDDFTVALWARVDGGSGYRSPITSRWSDTSGFIIYAASDNVWHFWTGTGVPGGWDVLIGPAVSNLIWTHITVTFQTTSTNGDVRTGSKKIYINGVLVAQKSGAYRPNRTGRLTVGAGGGLGNDFHFVGAIDEVNVFSKALSDSEVRSLSRADHDCAGLPLSILELRMDEAAWVGASNEVVDASGNGFDGRAANGPITASGSPANVGTCRYGNFLGNRGHVSVTYDQRLNPNDFTVSLWARLSGGSGYRSPITSRWEDGQTQNRQGFMIYAAPNNKWQFWTGAGSRWDVLDGPVATIGAWTHITISFESTSLDGNVLTGTKKLFINGVVENELEGQYQPNRNGPLTVGGGGGAGTSFNFVGDLDEVMVYDSALLASDIRLLGQATHDCTPATPDTELLLLSSHCDDEGIFSGGILPYYAQVLNVPVVSLTMVTRNGNGNYPILASSTSRVQELRNAIDMYAGQTVGSGIINGDGNYVSGNIVVAEGGLIDTGCCSSDPGYSWGRIGTSNWGSTRDVSLLTPGFGNMEGITDGRTAAAHLVAREIRRHRPRILATSHDLEGDYGHSNHAASSVSLIDGYYLAADPNFYVDGLAPWKAEKLYLRGTENDNMYKSATPSNGVINWYGFTPDPALNALFHDRMEDPVINGQSARDVAEVGVRQHLSQSALTDVASVFKRDEYFDSHHSEWWTCYKSSVKRDSLSDFTVPGDTTNRNYDDWARGDFYD